MLAWYTVLEEWVKVNCVWTSSNNMRDRRCCDSLIIIPVDFVLDLHCTFGSMLPVRPLWTKPTSLKLARDFRIAENVSDVRTRLSVETRKWILILDDVDSDLDMNTYLPATPQRLFHTHDIEEQRIEGIRSGRYG